MENIFSIVLFLIITAVLSVVLRRYDSAIALMMVIGAAILLLLLIVPMLSQVIESLSEVTSLISQGPFDIVIKAVGISVLSGLASDLCLDAGQNALSSIAILSGKVAIVVSALPLLGELMQEVLNILR